MRNLQTPLNELSLGEVSEVTTEAGRLLKLLLPVYMKYIYECGATLEEVYEDAVTTETVAFLGETPRPSVNHVEPNEVGLFVEWVKNETV